MLKRVGSLRSPVLPDAKVLLFQIQHRLAVFVDDRAVQQNLIHILMQGVDAVLSLLQGSWALIRNRSGRVDSEIIVGIG